ncbi:MAG: sigma-54-dependent Fis family transcriptional regulator [Burkholderiales bacterium]|nr:sigma-54-dependent Fis family transcriptional regulator [Burkholderiales bacterium]
MSTPPRPGPPPAGPRPLPELVSYLEGLPEPHILFDRQYRILAANAAYRRQFGPQGSVVGRTCYEVSHHFSVPCDQAGESCPLARSRQSGQRERVLHLHHTPQGEAYVNIELVPLHDARGEQAFFIEKMEPLTVAQGQPAAQGLIGRAPAFQQMLGLVARVGPSAASVLLLGESGTGKELVARAVHEAGPRAAAPLVVVDCASLPEALFESELFGHERGAFTGALASKAGLVEAASGGTLFLDEVGDIPLPMQVKLLRLLESGTYRRVGSNELRHADVRLVSATHRDLRAMVAEGRFREDLYYRLSTFPIRLPALRERAADIPLLATALLARVAGARRLALSAAALSRLAAHPFPGNVRELRNVLERAALLTDGSSIELAQIERALAADAPAGLVAVAGGGMPTPAAPAAPVAAAARTLREREHEALAAELAAHQGSRAALAARLGISERSLYRKLRALRRP